MKKIILIVINILIITSSLLSQNAIDPSVLPNNLLNLNSNSIVRENTNFIIGWNYGSPNYTMDTLLKINYSNHVLRYYTLWPRWYWGRQGDFEENQPRALSVEGVTNQLDSIICMKGYSMYYEPAITVDTSNLFNPDNYNQEGAAWGWLNKNTNIGYYQSSDITNRGNIQLRKANFNGNTTILSNVYPKNALFNHNDFNGKVFFNQRNNYNTKRWYLSVNLKSKEAINLLNFEKIALTIRLPYKYYDANGVSRDDYIEFTQIPATNVGNLSLDTIHIRGTRGDFRGYGRRENIVSPTEKFEIKGKMLALSNTLGNDSSITLSAFFELGEGTSNNKKLWAKPYEDSLVTYQIDVEVEYNDEIDIDLNWVKLETPHARDLFRGVWDNRIATLLNTYISRYDTPDSNVNNLKINRFYGDDEIGKDLWYGNRYFNMLVDTLANLETGTLENRPAQFLHATGFKEYWNGANNNFHKQISAPFFQKGAAANGSKSTFGFVDGYAGRDYDNYGTDSIKSSHYETQINIGYLDNFNNESYENLSRYQIRVQSGIEYYLIRNYVNNKSLLFSDKPWHAWIWPQSETWGYDESLETIFNTKLRPKTGEELSLISYLPVYLGAKGVFYWLKTKIYDVYHSSDEGPGSLLGLQASDDINYIDNLPKNINQFDQQSMNLDFFNFHYDDNYYRWNDAYNPVSYNFTLMNVTEDRVYLGLQTCRYELKKINEWLNKNSSDLMNMNLIAWYGKGHAKIKLGNFVQNYDDNIIDKFIDISQIRTRPLDRVENGQPLYEQHGTLDSGFYDIMIHQNGTTSLDDEWTLAVVNRRTDPLISDESNNQFYFISTHEFDELTNGQATDEKSNPANPSLTKTVAEWREKYWQRQGTREIRIKMKYEKPVTHDKVLLRVEELLAENEPPSGAEWWRQERWNNAIKDTVIRSDGELVLKMLPGEGRMFKVSVEETQDIVGELANSNQTKIIAYPAHQTSNQDYSGHDDSVYYHMVYHRKVDGTNRYGVYYRRSKNAYLHNMNTKTIQWGTEQSLANVIRLNRDIEPQLNVDTLDGVVGVSCDCKYPTLTARYDTDNQTAKIYVVFNCEGWILPDTPKVYIFERSFPIDAGTIMPTPLDPIGYAYASDVSNGLMIDRWGVPTINASLNGNFYAWNDTLLGIKAGFKRPENSGYITNLISFKFNDNTNYNALFPSMNTFSMIPYGEDNASLVWQETTNEFLPNASSKIYYTMLRTDQNLDIYHYAPPTVCDPNEPYFWDFTRKISDPNVLCISP